MTRLVALLVAVVVVCGAGAGIYLMASSDERETMAADRACNADAESVQTAADAYFSMVGAHPTSVATLTAEGAQGPWLRQAPVSPYYSIGIKGGGDVIVTSKTGEGGGVWALLGTEACAL